MNTNKIVVGVDSSEPSLAALHWAIDEARLRGAHLDVVVSWDYPVMAATEPMIVPTPDRDMLVESANNTAESMVSSSGLATAGIDFAVHSPEGRAGEELVAMSADADMLVVGSHGTGALKELVLGSVSNYCAHHATCPVVLVRPPATPD